MASCSQDHNLAYVDGFNPEGGDSTTLNIDTSMSIIDRSKLNRAQVYPGLVSDDVPRLTSVNASINISHLPQSNTLYRIMNSQASAFSVGYYAPAGELIKIVVPAGVYGLTGQIGVHTDDLSSIPSARRDPVIVTRKALNPGVNYMRNPYGGLIWINASIPYQNPVELVFSGVVKSADFVLGISDDATWIQEVYASKVPWLELRAPSIAFSVPTEKLKAFLRNGTLTSPTAVMLKWEEVLGQDFYEWMGFEPAGANISLKDTKPNTPERLVLDIHPVVGYAHAGSPVIAQEDTHWLNQIVNMSFIQSAGIWGIAHEFGHNYQQLNIWSWNGLGETSNNLFIFKIANSNNHSLGSHSQLAPTFTTGVRLSTERGADILNNASTLRNPNHFVLSNNPFYKIAPFVQIFQKLRDLDDPSNINFGWGFMPFLYKRARAAEFLSTTDLDKKDFFYEALCDYGKQDFQLFFDAWSIELSDFSRDKMSALYPEMKTRLWEYQPLDGTGGDVLVN